MVAKIDVRLPAERGIELGALLFLPQEVGPHPAITMAHGYAATREHGIERFARAFAEAGFVVLLHDHRNFGASGGEPRGDVDPWRQIADWRRAISYLESRPEVDPQRIGLWGTSYAGGHAMYSPPRIAVCAASSLKSRLSAVTNRAYAGYRRTLSRRWRKPSPRMSGTNCAANRPGATRW